MALQKQIDALRNETGMARPDQLLDVCEALLALVQEQEQRITAVLQAQILLDGRLHAVERLTAIYNPDARRG